MSIVTKNDEGLGGRSYSSSRSTITAWPAEWSPHSACILFYPHNPGTFRLEHAGPQFLALARTIVKEGEESVLLFCKDDTESERVKQLLGLDAESCKAEARIIVLTCPSNDAWARDTAPTFVTVVSSDEDSNSKTSLVGLDWDFNAYGGEKEGCYWPCAADQQAAANMCQQINKIFPAVIHKKVSLILEGGSIHTDGEGTVLTTKECLLHTSRNPNKSQAEIEEVVLEATGCTKMIWLEHGVDGDDDTNGHIDNWACFVAPAVVVLGWTDDAVHDAENYQRCRAALALLEASTDAKGRSLTVHKLHLPKPMYYTLEEIDSLQFGDYEGTEVSPREVGERMAASYVNFYIANKSVMVPQYGDAEFDPKAVQTLQELFPDRKVVGVPSREIITGGGNIHCITQQIPKL